MHGIACGDAERVVAGRWSTQVAGNDVGTGLSTQEASDRLQRDGPNELPEEQRTPIGHFVSLLWGPLPWMIEAAALAALLLRAWGSFWIIVANLGLTAVVAYWQEWRADRAVAALKAQLAPRARVLRDGVWSELPARTLVVDDIISVHLGDIVPADAELLEASRGAIALDRSSLTGESLPVECGPGDTLHAGTVIRRGSGTARVIATGSRIQFATTIQLVQKVVSVGHLQRIILRVGRDLILFALALDLLLVVVSLARQAPLAVTIEYALLLLVAAIPVSMPTVLSVAMAAGAQRLARDGVLVARLAAIEEMAALEQLCLDKTGTLTQSTLTAGAPIALPPATPERVLLDAALASETRPEDPVDQAIRHALQDSSTLAEPSAYQVLALEPFDSTRKRAEASVRSPDGGTFAVAKGAVQVILALAASETTPADRASVDDAVQELARRGYRTLAVARADQPGRWRIEGLIPLFDPLQPDACQAVEEVRAQGVTLKLLTGDQQAIGVEIARQVGIAGQLVLAGELSGGGNGRTPATLAALVQGAAGFTQVMPEDKYRIVEALQQAGYIVGMTGDGVNDTPALRKADVGIAVSGATEAARAASDLIMTKPGLSALARGIGESRRVFERMRTYVTYRLVETIRRLLSLTMAVIAFAIYPLSPVMLALLATFNAVVLVALAYDNVRPSPRPTIWRMDEVLAVAGALGVASLVEFFGLLYVSVSAFGLPLPQVQTLLYLSLSAAGYFTLLVTRTRGPFWEVRPSPYLLLAIAFSLGLGVLTALFGWFMAPVSMLLVAFVLGYSVLWFLVSDVLKRAAYAIVAWRSRRHPPTSVTARLREASRLAGDEHEHERARALHAKEGGRQ